MAPPDRRRSHPLLGRLARAAGRHDAWLVAGEGKAEMVARAQRGDRSIPIGRLPAAQAEWFLDAAAAPA